MKTGTSKNVFPTLQGPFRVTKVRFRDRYESIDEDCCLCTQNETIGCFKI